MRTNPDECEAAGVDAKAVASIARRLEKAAIEAQRLGIQVFGGSCGSLRFDDGDKRSLVLATMHGSWNGGCGAEWEDENGLIRGE